MEKSEINVRITEALNVYYLVINHMLIYNFTLRGIKNYILTKKYLIYCTETCRTIKRIVKLRH